jgi:protoporphyrinogen oxidase
MGVCSRGSSAVYVEAAVAAGSIGRTDIVAALQPQVLTALEELRWIRREDVACLVTHVIDCAYVHHTPERERVMDEIRSRLAAHGVHLIGRYGLWDYISMEDSIESAVAAVQERLG